jgi:hypothetical protein
MLWFFKEKVSETRGQEVVDEHRSLTLRGIKCALSDLEFFQPLLLLDLFPKKREILCLGLFE